ncbi:MAG: hypothetical protein WC977_11730 [Anaerovoracaceae bacterium]
MSYPAVGPKPVGSILDGIQQALNGEPFRTIARNIGADDTRFADAKAGRRHLNLAMLKAIAQYYQEYPELPERIGELVAKWLRTP